ncbi:hypothetical protein [Ktedonospora formicarum]|uniref:hypothetical protein n=1 Tax=Ktedonospora formicarum TaxID=2778364 RepID=UPI001C68DE9A|nr:hypothetical protein [Ktedonospora formicarum]
MFRITSLQDVFNGVLPQHADDFRTRQRLQLLRDYRQRCPETIYGDRQLLWWCPSCASAWWQADGIVALHLSDERLVQIGHRLHAQVPRDGSIPAFPRRQCPECVGAIVSIKVYPGPLGCQIFWQSLPHASTPPEMGKESTLFALLEVSQETDQSLDAIGKHLLTCLTDEPCELDAMAIQLDWAHHMLPLPRQDECHPLTAEHLRCLAHFELPAPGGEWKGFLWQPPQRLRLSPFPLILLLAAIQPTQMPFSIFPLYTRWQDLLPRIIAMTGWTLE